MDDKGILSEDRNLVQLLGTNYISSNTDGRSSSSIELSKQPYSACPEIMLNEYMAESAPNLAKKSDSTHNDVPSGRLCKSTDTLLLKLNEEARDGNRLIREQRNANLHTKRLVPYKEFECNRIGQQRKDLSGSNGLINDEKRILCIGNLNQRMAPLDYTLCLADYKTNWNLSKSNMDSKSTVRLSINTLVKHLHGLLIGYAILLETYGGSIIAEFTCLEDMDRVLRLPLANIFGTKVKSWRISRHGPYSQCHQHLQNTHLPQKYYQKHRMRSCMRNQNCFRYRRYLIAPDIPDSVPAPEIQNALRFQGLCTGQVWRHMPRGFCIEVLQPCDYERLRRDGVNFFNVAAFPVYPSIEDLARPSNVRNMGWDIKCLASKTADSNILTRETVRDIPYVILQQMQHCESIQCFKCQRFGHKAIHCKYWTRCVRCGRKHKVSDCDIPMTAASCCLCKGPHHAARSDCPMHRIYANAVQVSFTMTRSNANLKSSSFESYDKIWCRQK